jgi:hypothetical protein
MRSNRVIATLSRILPTQNWASTQMDSACTRRVRARWLNCYASITMRRLFSTFSLLLACSTGLCQMAAPTAISDFGYSSCSRNSCLFVPDDQHPMTYKRGEFSYTVKEDGTFMLSRDHKAILLTSLKDLNASVFVTWSEKNDWFAITWSDGGAIGNFHTRVFHVADDKVKETDSVGTTYANFRSRHWCETRGDNTQAYGWDRKTGTLVLVMSVYPTGDCGKDLGHTEAYLVQPTDGAILKHLTPREFDIYVKSHPQ